MGTNWNNPALSSTYSDFLTYLKSRDEDLAKMDMASTSGGPTGSKTWNDSDKKFQNWNGSSWVDLVIAVAGGGTGASTASGARTNLGLGTMATQADSSVSITGGTITGVNIAASAITSGTLALNRGGTGASLSLGAANYFLKVDGAGTAVEFGVNGSALTTLNATNISSGNLAIGRMPTGGTWVLGSTLTITTFGVVIGSATGGTQGAGTINATGLFVNGSPVSTGAVPSGLIAIFDAACPVGWTRVSAFDDLFLRGGSSYGTTGGDLTTEGPSANLNHNHTAPTYSTIDVDGGSAVSVITGFTSETGAFDATHTHEASLPPFITVVYCKKD